MNPGPSASPMFVLVALLVLRLIKGQPVFFIICQVLIWVSNSKSVTSINFASYIAFSFIMSDTSCMAIRNIDFYPDIPSLYPKNLI